MTVNDAAGSQKHIQALATLAAELAPRNIAIYAHGYDYMAFGSWSLVAGNRHIRVRLGWDGKESTLSAATAKLMGSGSPAAWQPFETLRCDGNDPWKAASDVIGRALAVAGA